MRFLIFDSNVVYAKKVAQLLHQHVREAEVDLAHNVPVLRRRLEGELGHKGTREYIKVLRLLEHATLGQLTAASVTPDPLGQPRARYVG